ncbi:MAG: tyrosine-protein phosphatase [Longimicrobiales bacterium]
MESILGDLGDLHSHLIPGVDDGAQAVEDALDAVDQMVRAGVRRIVTTPHLAAGLIDDSDEFEAYMAEVEKAWRQVHALVSRRFPEVGFHRGFEVAIDAPDADLSDHRLRMAGTSFMLIEWPRLHVPQRTERVVKRIRETGVKPIIAHPERYSGMDAELAVVGLWRDAGAYIQVNHGSLVGRYGKFAQQIAMELLEKGWVDFLSSDFHARSGLKPYIRESREALSEVGAEEQFRTLTATNPARLLTDEDPIPVQPLFVAPGWWDRVKGMFGGSGRRRP